MESSRKISPREVRRHYQLLDPLYRELWGEQLHHGLWETGEESANTAVRALTLKVAEAAGVGEGDSICDIGCGYGAAARQLAEEYSASVTGITLTPAQFHRARKIEPAKGNLRFLLGDWQAMRLPRRKFQRALMIESSEHAERKSLYFQKAYDALGEEGTLALAAWMESEKEMLGKRNLLQPLCDEGRMPSLLTPSGYRKVLEEAGFTVTSEEDISEKVKRTWLVVMKRMALHFVRHPTELVAVLRPGFPERDFLLAPARMWAAYEAGALRYVVMGARKKRGPMKRAA